MNSPKKILVIRNDKIGDFMLAWPALSLLKQQYPGVYITALVPRYTAPLAEQCEWIDEVLIDEKEQSFFKDIIYLSKKIRYHKFDASISLYSEARTSIALFLANVSERIGPATKIAQLFLNNRLTQKRSRSLKPEYEYNTDLIKHYIYCNGNIPVSPHQPPFLSFNQTEIDALKNSYLKEHGISNDRKLIFIHPGTGGSAVNLSLEQYAMLLLMIAKESDVYIVITAGPDEIHHAEHLSGLLKAIDHHVHVSSDGIISFSKLINICDIFISGSTGPLHIAGALNIRTVAFYPARQSATSLRWQTMNVKEYRLAISPDNYSDESDMQRINIADATNHVLDKFFRN